MDRREINVLTGVETVIPLTLEEEADAILRTAAEAAAIPQRAPKWAAIEALIEQNLDTLPETYFQTLTNGDKKKAKNRWEKRDILKISSSVFQYAVANQLATQQQINDVMIRAAQIAAAD